MAEDMRETVADLLRGIDRYNPDNLPTLETYVELQARENTYDLEANLAVLKLYQFNPNTFKPHITAIILLKALTNLPHTDFTLCKCLIDAFRLEEEQLARIIELADLLETCRFSEFWKLIVENPDVVVGIVGFDDSIRKFICHVITITYQSIHMGILRELLGQIPDPQLKMWINKYGWKDYGTGEIFVSTQEDSIKTKNITEKITFDSVRGIMGNYG